MNIILYTSSGNRSGGSRQALYLAQGMTRRGHRVHFFVPENSTLPAIAPEEPFWRSLGARHEWRRQIESVMLPDGPNVVHAFHNAAVKKAAWWGLFWKKKAVVAAHRGVLFRPNNPLPYWSPGIDRFLVNSRACARVLRTVGLSSKRIVYVPNSVPDERVEATLQREYVRNALGVPNNAFLFMTVANNSKYKGVTELIRAFAKAFPSDWQPGSAGLPVLPHLLVIGVSPGLWQPLAAEAGKERHIHFLDSLEDVGNYLKASSAFVLPSLTESMPNTLLEAVRAGLPCIGTTVGAVPDILQGEDAPSAAFRKNCRDQDAGACGLLVPPGDVQALADALFRLATDIGLRRMLAANARIHGDKYRPERRLDLVESIYSELLRSKGLYR